MSNRIRGIFASIHRPLSPLTNGRRVLALSRVDAEKMPLLPGISMISITTPGLAPAQLPEYEFILRLSFSDVDFLATDLPARAVATLPRAMTKEQATQVINFVKTLPNSVHTLLVHCEGGFSRSCGVSAALGNIFGYEVETERLAKANLSVKKLLIDEATGARDLFRT